MPLYKMDPLESVDVEIRADTPSVFRFIAQKRVPGRDYRDSVSYTHLTLPTNREV